MKVKLIGSHLCQDTMYALMKLKDNGAEVDFANIAVSFPALKEFLEIREKEALYDAVKKAGGIGIPCFVLEDGSKTLNLNDVLAQLK